MTPRQVRTIRTVLQVILAVCSVIPAFVAGLPDPAVAVQVVVVAGLVTRYFHLLEALPFFPDALKLP